MGLTASDVPDRNSRDRTRQQEDTLAHERSCTNVQVATCNFRKSEVRVDVRPFIGWSWVKEPAGRKMVAAISGAAAAFGGVTCVACAPAGLGRCTRMHKELKPRSMSETGHLPTDVESSGRDPGAATLQAGALSALSLSPPRSTWLSSLFFTPPCSWRVGTFPIPCTGNLCPPYVNRIQHSPPASGPPPNRRVFFKYKKRRAFQERYGRILRFLISEIVIYNRKLYGTNEKRLRNKVNHLKRTTWSYNILKTQTLFSMSYFPLCAWPLGVHSWRLMWSMLI